MEQDWRYEIKYVVTPSQWFQINRLITCHPAGFSTAFPDRIVNNIYYDTPDFAMCRDNLAGISQRKKFRLRWYGEPEKILNPVFEIKIKNNALGRKEFFKIDDYRGIGNDDNWINDVLTGMPNLKPVLQNQYLRSYYINVEGNFRLTVDRQIRYQKVLDKLMTNRTYAFEDSRIVIELKFKAEDIKRQKEITRFIHFRNSKHSKYLTGIFYCY